MCVAICCPRSMLYQIPLLLSCKGGALCLVVLPLKALMKDQERALTLLGLRTLAVRPPSPASYLD